MAQPVYKYQFVFSTSREGMYKEVAEYGLLGYRVIQAVRVRYPETGYSLPLLIMELQTRE